MFLCGVDSVTWQASATRPFIPFQLRARHASFFPKLPQTPKASCISLTTPVAHSVRLSHVGDLEFVVPEFRLRRTALSWLLTDPATRVLIVSWICQCSLVDRKPMTQGRRYTYLPVKSWASEPSMAIS